MPMSSPQIPELKSRSGDLVERTDIRKFAAGFSGRTSEPGQSEYERDRRIWNAAIDKRPGLIAFCANAADVVHAVNFARERDILLAVRSGGHNVAGRAVCDDGMVIDLSLMKAIAVDPRHRTVCVEAGATLGDVDESTHRQGLAVPTGVVSKTGIAGLTLGGGVGWLVRKYGLTCDNVLSFDVVTAQGETISAGEDTHPDLFWALRGGGGNFGVVTSFLYRAHAVSTVLGGLIAYPREQAPHVFRQYRAFMEAAPDELTAYAALLHTPDGVPVVALAVCYCGDVAEGERVLKPLRTLAQPLMDAIQPMPFPRCKSWLTRLSPMAPAITGSRPSSKS